MSSAPSSTHRHCHHWRHQHHQRQHQRRHILTLFACLWGQMQKRQVAFVAQRMGQWEAIIDHTHPPIYTSDTTVRTHPLLYSREVTVLIAGGGCRWASIPPPATHTASPPLMSQQTTAESKELRKGNTEIKTAANVFADILIPIDIWSMVIIIIIITIHVYILE